MKIDIDKLVERKSDWHFQRNMKIIVYLSFSHSPFYKVIVKGKEEEEQQHACLSMSTNSNDKKH